MRFEKPSLQNSRCAPKSDDDSHIISSIADFRFFISYGPAGCWDADKALHDNLQTLCNFLKRDQAVKMGQGTRYCLNSRAPFLPSSPVGVSSAAAGRGRGRWRRRHFSTSLTSLSFVRVHYFCFVCRNKHQSSSLSSFSPAFSPIPPQAASEVGSPARCPN